MGRLASDARRARFEGALSAAPRASIRPAVPAAMPVGGPERAPAGVWVLADDKLGHTTQSLGTGRRAGMAI